MGWGSGNLGGGGGGGLNFKVVQYTSTPTGTAKENTIGVVTSTAISGWVMQAEQPTAVAGLVWIEVAAESAVAFYADKKQMVKLYPKAVKQYVNGAWTNTEAHVYQNGEWVNFSSTFLYLYKEGDACESITGGWTGDGVTANGSYLSFSKTISAGGNTAVCRTQNKVLVQEKSNLVIDIDYPTARDTWLHGLVFGVFTTASPGKNLTGSLAHKTIPVEIGSTLARQEIKLDVSSVSSEAYVLILGSNGSGTVSTNVNLNLYNCYLE